MVWNEKLIESAKNGDLEKVKECLANGANVNFRTKNGKTALMLASWYKNIEIVKLLVENRANVNFIDKHNNSALYYAKTDEIWDYLKPKVKNINNDLAFINCAMRGNLEQVKHFLSLSKGASINTKNKSGKTALMYASLTGNLAVVKYLIARGADTNIKDKNNKTALDYTSTNETREFLTYNIFFKSAKNGDLKQIQKCLASAIININTIAKSGKTALMIACQNGNFEIAIALIKNGTDLNIKDSKGKMALNYVVDNNRNKDSETFLIWACKNGNLEMVKLLISKGSNLNARDKDDNTALISASSSGHLEVVKCLIENGLNIEDKNKYGYTALKIASLEGNFEIVKYLISKGADTNARGIYDETTALMEASSSGHLGIVKFLVNNGADINAKTNGKPVLDFAENDTIREFLKSKGAK